MKDIIKFLMIISFFCCVDKSEQPIVSIGEEPDVIISNFKDKYNSGLQKIWTVDSKFAEIYENRKLVYLKDVYVEFYKNNRVNSSVKANRGIIDYAQKKVTGISNVIVKSDDGSVLCTESLTYDDKIAKFITDDYVKIIRPKGDVIEGIGMEADKSLEKVVIKKKIKGKLKDVKK